MMSGSDPVVDPMRWVRWRADRLLAAGFSAELARQLACDRGMDMHALLELVDRGCPPHLAARIMAPLDDPVRSEPHSRS
jgi:hypothetical protein